ncbi:MAG: diguanylate cyclase [Candidatus Competibacter sp.]
MPSDHKTPSFQERKARLRQSFLAQLPERLKNAQEQIAGLASGNGREQTLETLHLLFHSLKGSSASFGLQSISTLAQRAEQALRTRADGEEAIAALIAGLGEVTDALEQLAHDAAGSDGSDGSDTTCEFEIPDPQKDREMGGSGRREKWVYLCDDDPIQVQQLTAQLDCFGYQVTPFTSLAALRRAVEEKPPTAIIMDVMFPEGIYAGPQELAELNVRTGQTVPSVFISCRDDFDSRLQAVKAGGSAYCPKPVKANEIVEILDFLTNQATPDPFRILVVDDEPEVARYHALVLEEAGMVVEVATAPKRVLAVLDAFRADLVLMDMYMPDCSGPELARLLRQIPGYVSLPIIYVSSETDVDRQFKALEVGADGFLTKPIEPSRLVVEVSLRAERMRTLHSLMVRDSLTGLFNHNAIMQFLDIELADARRRNSPLCFAMLDVDHFKKVNDSHGHPVGDQVLVALSRGLRLRMRDSDLVGRYGGEEFALVLSGLEVGPAKKIIDTLRKNFAGVVFFAGQDRFTCTFSGGVAAFPEFSTAAALVEAADQALYRAKHGGRNRVEVARADTVPSANLEMGNER